MLHTEFTSQYTEDHYWRHSAHHRGSITNFGDRQIDVAVENFKHGLESVGKVIIFHYYSPSARTKNSAERFMEKLDKDPKFYIRDSKEDKGLMAYLREAHPIKGKIYQMHIRFWQNFLGQEYPNIWRFHKKRYKLLNPEFFMHWAGVQTPRELAKFQLARAKRFLVTEFEYPEICAHNEKLIRANFTHDMVLGEVVRLRGGVYPENKYFPYCGTVKMTLRKGKVRVEPTLENLTPESAQRFH